MTRRLALCAAIALATLVPATPAHAAVGDVSSFDTVDAIKAKAYGVIEITGILAGNTVSATHLYSIARVSADVGAAVERCDRFALLAMSKPGKYVFSVVAVSSGNPQYECQLALRPQP